jgi:hypothetical protein
VFRATGRDCVQLGDLMSASHASLPLDCADPGIRLHGRMVRSVFAGSLLFFACGCASSGTGVPDLEARALTRPRFLAVQPRELTLSVGDSRKPAPDDEGETQREVHRAVAESFRYAGFALKRDAAHSLVLTIGFPERTLQDFEREDCVRLVGEMRLGSGAWARAEGTGCYKYKHWLGFSLGGDATKAYETTLNYVLDELDRQLRVATSVRA